MTSDRVNSHQDISFVKVLRSSYYLTPPAWRRDMASIPIGSGPNSSCWYLCFGWLKLRSLTRALSLCVWESAPPLCCCCAFEKTENEEGKKMTQLGPSSFFCLLGLWVFLAFVPVCTGCFHVYPFFPTFPTFFPMFSHFFPCFYLTFKEEEKRCKKRRKK